MPSRVTKTNNNIVAAMTLDQINKNQIARIAGFVDGQPDLVARLREVGFAEDDEVELLHRGPLGGRPLCFRLNRTQIALRPDEASAIKVEVLA